MEDEHRGNGTMKYGEKQRFSNASYASFAGASFFNIVYSTRTNIYFFAQLALKSLSTCIETFMNFSI